MANLKTVSKKSKAQSMGMHTEVLTGRTQQKFFNPDAVSYTHLTLPTNDQV